MIYNESPGAGFTRQDLKRFTMLGNKALSFAIKRLMDFNILKKSKENKSLAVYKLNHGNKYLNDILSLLEKERSDLNYIPYEFGIIIRELLRKAIEEINPIKAYLFGSVAKKTYRKDSDIDIALIIDKKDPSKDLLIDEISEKLSNKYNRKIQCFIFTKKQFEDKKDALIKDILKQGIRLI